MKIVLVLALTYLPVMVISQSLQEIRSYYQTIAEQIHACEQDPNMCTHFKNVLEINSNDQPWQAVGSYAKSVEFWYTDDPTKCDDCNNEGKSVLDKVIVREAGSTYTSLTEFLYKNGELIFCYRKNEDEYGLDEKRFYFERGLLIRYQWNQDVLDPSESDSGINQFIKDRSNSYQQIFINSF